MVNGACKDNDFKHMNEVKDRSFKGKDLNIKFIEDHSLIAVQGPKAHKLMEDILGISLVDMDFMSSQEIIYKKENAKIRLSRCGYTGEDGFEISVPNSSVVNFVEHLRSFKDDNSQSIA